MRLGTPICLTYGSEAGITSVATLLMGSFGPGALAAHNVVNQLAYIVYQSNIGLSQGSSILVSRSVGQGRRSDASQTARQALTLSAALMGLVGVVYLVGTPAMLLFAFVLGLDGPGIWLGLCAGFGATALLLLCRFRQDAHRDGDAALRPS